MSNSPPKWVNAPRESGQAPTRRLVAAPHAKVLPVNLVVAMRGNLQTEQAVRLWRELRG